MRSRVVLSLLAVVVSSALVAVILSQIELAHALERVRAADPRVVVLAGLLYVVVVLGRGLRFTLLAERSGFVGTTAATGLQSFLIRVTPFRLGELFLPLLLQRRFGEDVARSVVSLLFVRVLDLCLILTTTLGAAVLLGGLDGAGRLTPMLGLVVAVVAVLVFFRPLFRVGIRFGSRFAQTLGLLRFRPVAKVLERLGVALDGGQQLSPRRMAGIASTSLVVLIANTAHLGLLLFAFGVVASPLQIALGASVAQVGASLPLATVGSIGTLEASWTLGFTWAGVALEEALLTGVAVQVVTLGFNCVVALPCWLQLLTTERRPRLDAPTPR